MVVAAVYAITAEAIEMPFGADSCGPKKAYYIRRGSRSDEFIRCRERRVTKWGYGLSSVL